MKKMRNGRRGFTLLEMVIVIAIIVILSSAAVFGVATTLNRAHAGQAELKAHNGNNFEAAARNKVRSYGANSVDWSTIPKYTPENEALKQQKKLVEEDEWDESEVSEIEYDVEGFHVVKEYNPDLHHGLKDEATFVAWREEKNSYLEKGYLMSEIEQGTTYADGSYVMKPVWDPKNHDNMTYDEYQKWLKEKTKPTTTTTTTGGSGGGSTGGAPKTVGNVSYAPAGSNGKAKVNEVTNTGDKQTIKMTSLDGENASQIWLIVEKRGNDYYATCDGEHGAYIFVQGGLQGANYNNQEFKLTDAGKKWLENNYGITLS